MMIVGRVPLGIDFRVAGPHAGPLERGNKLGNTLTHAPIDHEQKTKLSALQKSPIAGR